MMRSYQGRARLSGPNGLVCAQLFDSANPRRPMPTPSVAPIFFLLLGAGFAQAPTPQDPKPEPPEAQPEEPAPPRGLIQASEGAVDGYTLIAPLRSTTTWLVDMQGEEVHRWESKYSAGNSAYLLEDGSLLRCGKDTEPSTFHGGGQGGIVERFSWEGELLWTLDMSSEDHLHHHDIEPLPNGNILVIAWESRTAAEAIAAGREPHSVEATEEDEEFTLWPDMVLEIEPILPVGGKTLWAWHAWDHLIQDYDDQAPHFGVISERPERIDVNAGLPEREETATERRRREELEAEMRALGYLGEEEDEEGDDPDAAQPAGRRVSSDWLHTNGIDYHAETDLIAISIRTLSEVWIIDHSTTMAEAAGSEGGRYGHGGDLLYRWGNPKHYGRGRHADRTLFGQHDPRLVTGSDGSLRLTVFNNGEGRGEEPYSSVDEMLLPFEEGRFQLSPTEAFGPDGPVWSYSAEDKTSFFSSFISGAHRLPGGNTLICSGAQSRIFEVTPGGEVVWDYLNPYGDAEPEGPGAEGRGRDGRPGPGGRGRPEGRPDRRGRPPGRDGPPDRGGPPGRGGPPDRDGPGDRGGPPDRDGPDGGPPPDGGNPPPRGGGGMDPHALFRATRIEAGYAGLSKLEG
ncbi:MAG TPA: hypothetical protein EYQ74_13370 [Planctomycetes bacterium]|nr:hypothetical protein [Planctomycetota bacterium]HIK61977.1 hypothetical protein [Planctomycetota bacterium]